MPNSILFLVDRIPLSFETIEYRIPKSFGDSSSLTRWGDPDSWLMLVVRFFGLHVHVNEGECISYNPI